MKLNRMIKFFSVSAIALLTTLAATSASVAEDTAYCDSKLLVADQYVVFCSSNNVTCSIEYSYQSSGIWMIEFDYCLYTLTTPIVSRCETKNC